LHGGHRLGARSKNPDLAFRAGAWGCETGTVALAQAGEVLPRSFFRNPTPPELRLGDVELVGKKSAQRPLDFGVKCRGVTARKK